MAIKQFNLALTPQQDAGGVFATLPAVPVSGWPFVVVANGLRLWAGYSLADSRLSLPADAAGWHIEVTYWGESSDGLGAGGSGGSIHCQSLDVQLQRIATALEEKLCGCQEAGDTNVTVNATQQQQADELSDMEKRLQELKIASTGQAIQAGAL
ncbi:MAG: hypothetical protein R3F02_18780 [Thiolinea sp.]